MNSFRDYLEYSEKYLRLGDEIPDKAHAHWSLIPAAILAWSAVESFVNNMLDDFGNLPEDLFQLHERALLLEKRIKFVDHGNDIGNFILEGTEYRRLEEKILFLIAKFSGKSKQNIKSNNLWQKFQSFKEIRDYLIHPRRTNPVDLDKDKVEKFIETSKEIISLISQEVWNKKVIF